MCVCVCVCICLSVCMSVCANPARRLMDRRSQQVYKTFDKLGIPGPRPDFFLGNAGQLSKGVSCVVVAVVLFVCAFVYVLVFQCCQPHLWGFYSETSIHDYNKPLAHSFTRLCMITFSLVHPALYLSPPLVKV